MLTAFVVVSVFCGTGIWRVVHGPSETLGSHETAIHCLAYSSDGNFLASGSGDPEPKVWDVRSKQLVYTLEDRPGYVESIAFSPDGKTLALASDEGQAVSRDSGGVIRGLGGNADEKASQAKLYDAPTGQLKFALFNPKPISTVAFAPGRQSVATASGDGLIRLWDVKTGKEDSVLKEPDGYFCVSAVQNRVVFSAKRNMAAVPRKTEIEVFALPPGDEKHVLKGHNDDVVSISFSPDGKQLASIDWSGTAMIWDWANKKIVHSMINGEVVGRAVSFSPDGKLVATATSPKFPYLNWGELTFRDAQTGNVVVSHSAHWKGIYCLAFSTDGTQIATGGADGTIQLWKVPLPP